MAKTTSKTTDESSGVMSYRVQKLEEAVELGFAAVNGKLDKLNGFITEEDSEKMMKRGWEKATFIHSSIEKRLTDLENRKWVHNTLSAILGSVLTFLAVYVVTDIISK